MSGNALSKLERLFDAAVRLPPAERSTYLDREAGNDPKLRGEVEKLLASESGLGRFLAEPLGPRMARKMGGPQTDALKAGDRIGDALIVRKIGQGGFATVYLAEQVSLGRPIALKVSKDIGDEARTVAKLEHDYIVKVYFETIENGLRYIGMQYVPGETLEDVRVRLDETSGGGVKRALRLCQCIALALDYAHGKGVVHLDVKPSNILMHTSGRPMLADFNVSLSERSLQEGSVPYLGGTEWYMAPEQRRALQKSDEERPAALAEVDRRADVYSLGKVLEELVTPAERTPDIAYVLTKATSESASDRFQTAGELARSLDACLEARQARALLAPRGRIGKVLQAPAAAIAGLVGVGHGLGLIAALRLAGDETEQWRWTVPAYLLLLVAALVAGRRSIRPVSSGVASAEARRRVLAAPARAAVLALVPWAPFFGALLVSAWKLHGLPAAAAPIVLGLAMLALATASIAALATAAVGVRARYPSAWSEPLDLRRFVEAELGAFLAKLRFAYLGAALLPALAAVVFLLIAARGPASRAALDVKYGSFVKKAFEHALARAPEAVELAEWSARFATLPQEITPFACALLSMVDSPEGHRTLVSQWFRRYLHDPRALTMLKADPEVAAFAVALDRGDAYVDTLARFLVEKIPAGSEFVATVAQRLRIPPPAEKAAESPQASVQRLLRSRDYARAAVDEWFVQLLGWSIVGTFETSPTRFWTEHIEVMQDHTLVIASIMAHPGYTGFPMGAMAAFPSASCGKADGSGVSSVTAAPLAALGPTARWFLVLAAFGALLSFAAGRLVGGMRHVFGRDEIGSEAPPDI